MEYNPTINDIQTSINGLILTRPDTNRDAPFALGWFESSDGKETLLLMGNAENKIDTPSIEEETNTINEFLILEKKHEQLTWMIRYDDKTIGAVWLELQDTEHLKSPAFHIMIGDKAYRGKGFGKAIMQEMISYARDILKSNILYSRHLTSNTAIARLTSVFGFTNDDRPYTDRDGIEFQNIKLEL